MTNHRQTERSKDDGPHPEGGKAGSPFRDHLAATLAHELRDPLASILTSLEVLRRNGVDPSVARQAHERAERQARHMARIVEDMLDIFRSGHGTLRLRKERVVLTALMVDAIETARPLITSRGHHLTVSLPPQPVSLLGDPSRLHQVITNLLTNAARYTAPGGEIGLAAEVADGVVVLRVRDDGMGIAPELLPRVFDLSQRGDRPGDRAFGDLGIGLVVVKALVELHGGSIAAYSQGPSTGSEFVVRLPGCAPSREEGRAPGGLARVISAGLVIGPWLRPTGGRWWQVLLAAAALALTALLQFVWLDRARSTRRWKAALDAYAEREIARDRRKPRDVEAPARRGGSMSNGDVERRMGPVRLAPDPPLTDWLVALSHDAPFERQPAAEPRAGNPPPLTAVASILSLLQDPSREVRLRAITALGDLAGEIRRVLPTLRSALEEAALRDRDDGCRAEAVHALLRAGPQAATEVAGLVEALHSSLDVVRFHAATALGAFGPGGRPAIPALIHASLWDEEQAVRVGAAMALWKIDRKGPLVLQVLIQALDDANELICWITVESLGQMGPAAREAVPALRRTLGRDFRLSLIKAGVRLALERIDPQAPVGAS